MTDKATFQMFCSRNFYTELYILKVIVLTIFCIYEFQCQHSMIKNFCILHILRVIKIVSIMSPRGTHYENVKREFTWSNNKYEFNITVVLLILNSSPVVIMIYNTLAFFPYDKTDKVLYENCSSFLPWNILFIGFLVFDLWWPQMTCELD